MDSYRVARLREQVKRMFNTNPPGTVIQLNIGNKVCGQYEIPENHFVTLDMKTPVDWLKGALTFSEIDGIKGNPSLSIKI